MDPTEPNDFSESQAPPLPPAWLPPMRFATQPFAPMHKPAPEEQPQPFAEGSIHSEETDEENAQADLGEEELDEEMDIDGEEEEYEDSGQGAEEILEALEQGFHGLKEELNAANTESRRNSKRVMEILRQFGQILDAVSGTVRDLHESSRQAQIDARSTSPSQNENPSLSATAFIEFFDRLKRIRDAANAPPPLPERNWFAGSAVERALTPWKEERLRLRQSLVLLEEHAAQLLRNSGLEPVAAKGNIFDPSCMVAVETVQEPSLPDHCVASEILTGWKETATGQVLRAAQVRVARNQPTNQNI